MIMTSRRIIFSRLCGKCKYQTLNFRMFSWKPPKAINGKAIDGTDGCSTNQAKPLIDKSQVETFENNLKKFENEILANDLESNLYNSVIQTTAKPASLGTISRILYSFASVGSRYTKDLSIRYIPQIESSILKDDAALDLDEFLRLIWSLSVGNAPVTPELASRVAEKSIQLFSTSDSIKEDQLSRLYHWWLHLENGLFKEQSTISNTTCTVFDRVEWIKLLMRARGSVQVCLSCAASNNVLKFQQQVGEVLKPMGYQSKICPFTGYHLDFVDIKTKTVVDCLGSTHYIINNGKFQMDGHSLLKQRLLLGVGGWKRVVVIPYFKWVRKQKNERKDWIMNQIFK